MFVPHCLGRGYELATTAVRRLTADENVKTDVIIVY